MKRLLYQTVILFSTLLVVARLGAQAADVKGALEKTAAYILETVPEPDVGSVGGEWAVIGLARSGCAVPASYYTAYYGRVEARVKECGGNLHERKYTEYARVILALSALGKNPENVGGYNLLMPLGDYDKTLLQGVNGPIWALIALDSGAYSIPDNPSAQIQATRELYLKRILDCRLADGGWALDGKSPSDPDVTGMALQALANYKHLPEVKKAIDKALSLLSSTQNERGGFSYQGAETSESCVQILIALCELGISPDDARFVKNGNSLLDYLMTYAKSGGFRHTYSEKAPSPMASEQGLYALAAVARFAEGKSSLYRMKGEGVLTGSPDTGASGLPGKHADVRLPELRFPGKTFSDITGHEAKTAIEALAARGIINGKTADSFLPDETMTRAEFAAITVRGLGLPKKANVVFDDVAPGDWFAPYVGAAHAYGIVTGVSAGLFSPDGTLSREEAAVMIARSAALCGMNTTVDTFTARNLLAGFTDYVRASDWAVSSLAFCCKEGILSDEQLELKPKEPVTRAEIAQMLFHMLEKADLL